MPLSNADTLTDVLCGQHGGQRDNKGPLLVETFSPAVRLAGLHIDVVYGQTLFITDAK